MPEPNLQLVSPTEPSEPSEKRACRKCGRTDVKLRSEIVPGNRDHICDGCNYQGVRKWQKENHARRRKQSKESSARRRVEYPEKYLWQSAKQRAKKAGVPFEIQPKDIIIPPCCPVLGIPLQPKFGRGGWDASPSIDRLLPEKGYVVGNVAVISNRANRIKSNASPEEIERVAAWLRATLKK